MDEERVEPIPLDELVEPLREDEAKRLILAILRGGTVGFTSHARERLRERELTTVDVVNVLRAGVVECPEEDLEKGWTYRVATARIGVVVCFRSRSELVVVTAWRVGT